MKTIIVFSANVDKWGAERSTCSLCKHLQDTGNHVLVVIPRKGAIIDLLEENGLNYIINDFISWTYIEGPKNSLWQHLRETKYNLLQLIFLRKTLKTKNIQPILIYSNTLTFGFGIFASILYQIPHIQHIRENIDAFGMKFKWGFKPSMWIMNHFSKKVICTCNAIKERYKEYIDPTKVLSIYNGIPISEFSNSSKSFDYPFRIVFIGRLMEDKRPIDLLKAVKIMVENNLRDIQVDIYGDGIQEGILKDYITSNNLQKFISLSGYQSNIDLTKYDVGIMSSIFEAFARVTLEFMMSGLAVIGSNSGGTKEQVVHGETGLLYESCNSDALFLCLKELYLDRHKCAQYGLNGRIRVEKLFSQNSYVNGVTEQFKMILAK